jgi:hypothetical protein
MAYHFSGRLMRFVSTALTLAAFAGSAQAAVGDKLDLSGLIKLPTEDWSTGLSRVYSPANANQPDLMWRSSWTAAGDAAGPAAIGQSVMSGKPYGHSNSRVANDGPTSATALHYNPFSIITRPNGSKALRITPKYLANPADRAKVWGYPVVSGELSTAGKNVNSGGGLEFYAANYSVTVYRGVRLPKALWAALWKYSRADYGGGGLTEIDLLETMRGNWPKQIWLSLHSNDDAWRQALIANPKPYTGHLTQWAGPNAASLQYAGLSGKDPHALHDWALVVGPKVVQWALDGVVVFELPTPKDVGPKMHHDIIDLDYGTDLPAPTSQADLDAFEIGPIERYSYPGLSHVRWQQKEAGDGGAIAGAHRLSGVNVQQRGAAPTKKP